LQRVSLKDGMPAGHMISVSTANAQMMQHPSPTISQMSSPMTPRPMPPGTPGTPHPSIARSPIQPSTPLQQQDLPVQSPVSNDMSPQLPVITPPAPPPPYPGIPPPPPPYPSQLKVRNPLPNESSKVENETVMFFFFVFFFSTATVGSATSSFGPSFSPSVVCYRHHPRIASDCFTV
jgi:hypothetical protein